MKNLGRVIRLSLTHRFTFLGSVVCALAVSVLWGGNIGAVYPFVEVVFKGQSLHQWIDGKIDESRRVAADCSARIDENTRSLDGTPDAEQARLRAAIRRAEEARSAELRAQGWYLRLRPYIHQYLPADPFLTLVLLIVLLLAGTTVKSLFLVAQTVLVGRLSHLGTYEFRKLFFRRTLRMDLATFNNEGTSDLMSRFTYDMESVTEGLNALFGKLIREPLKMAVCLIGAGVICWRLLALSLLVAPVAALLIRWLARMLKRANRRAMEEMAQIYNTLEEAFRGIKVVKSFTMEQQERRRFHANSKQYYRKAMKIARYDSLTHPLTEMMGIAMISLALLAGAWLVLENETHLLGIRMCSRPLDLPSLLLFYSLLAGSADPARKLSEIFTRLQRASAAADRICALADREPQVRDPQHPRDLARHHKHLVFDGVDFAYQPGRPVLSGIRLDIPFGETIAVVGPSGCGKSTLANLVPRFADPTAGVIRLDDIPLTEVRLRDLRSQIGLVTQEPVLFDDTVFNNIRCGSPHASAEQVIEAAKQAHAHRFIEHELPHGYQTPVGPSGGQLSGGQRQRIALARAILRDPSLLILDEATSQVDLETEQVIHSVLERFIRGRTTIIITHRLSALSLANRIVVMEDGRILAVGAHDELVQGCPFYRRLYEIQFEDCRRTA